MKTVIRGFLRRFGFDIVRPKYLPDTTLLGLARQPIKTVIDVGANVGQFARYISGFFPQAKLYCFEPLQGPYETLCAWASSAAGRVRCFQCALGRQDGRANMYRHDDHTASSSVLPATEECHALYPQTTKTSIESVRITSLDNALRHELAAMPREVLLKLDVQGFEDRVLLGAERVLAVSTACLLEINLYPLYEGQASFLDLARLLDEYGLAYAGNLKQTYDKDGRVVFLDALFVKSWK